MTTFDVVQAESPLPSLFRVEEPSAAPPRVGAVQCGWDPDPTRHLDGATADLFERRCPH